MFGSSKYSVGKSWMAAAGLDSAGPHPLIPSPTRKDTRERAYPRCCRAMRTSGEMCVFCIFFTSGTHDCPLSFFFRRGDQGVRSSVAVDSPDFQKNTCVRDGYYASTHKKLRRAKCFHLRNNYNEMFEIFLHPSATSITPLFSYTANSNIAIPYFHRNCSDKKRNINARCIRGRLHGFVTTSRTLYNDLKCEQFSKILLFAKEYMGNRFPIY